MVHLPRFGIGWYLLLSTAVLNATVFNSGGPCACFSVLVFPFFLPQFDSKIIASAATMVYISGGMSALNYYSFIFNQITFYCARE